MKPRFVLPWLALCFVLCASHALSHELRPAYLELTETAPNTFDVLWKVPAAGSDLRLALYINLPSNCKNLTEPRGLISAGAYVERWKILAEGGLAGTISIDGLSATATDVLARVQRLDGSSQVARVLPSQPSFNVSASPNLWMVAGAYLALGIEHILTGPDHLLFVLGLLLIVEGRMKLLKTITAFTVAHSLTLAAATLGYLSAPVGPLEACIALSILFLGPEIVRKWRGETSLMIQYPWVVAFAFGLLHGFGFASGLNTTGMATSAIPQALFFFNMGVELGQLLFVGLLLAVAWLFSARNIPRPAWVLRVPGYAVGVSGAFWSIQRIVSLFISR